MVLLYFLPLSANGQMSNMGGGQSMSSNQSMSNMSMNQMRYAIQAMGNSFQVMIASNSNLPQNLQFNQDQKSLSFGVKGLMMQDLTHYEITIPQQLLNGNFTVTVGGKQIMFVPDTNNTTMQTTLHFNIAKSFIQQNGIGDSSTIMVTATQAIPEFGFIAGLVVAISITGVVVISRKFRFHF